MPEKIEIRSKTFEVGKNLNVNDLRTIEKATGYAPATVISRVQDKYNIRPTDLSKTYATSVSTQATNNDNSNANNNANTTYQGLSREDLGYLFQDVIGPFQESIATINANATVNSATIRGEADKEVAKAYADAQKYASTLGLEGVKYGADKESEWRQAVANIEVKGKLDLQPIINAGLERVAGIEAQSARDVAETTGRYSLESMKERTSADKNIGKMQLAGSMYGLLGSVFG